MMDLKYLMFEVHHGDRFNREHRCTYLGGDVVNYPDPYDRDKMSFIEVERVVESYGYGPGDLIYYNIPNKSLNEGLRLLSFDHDILEMVAHHTRHTLVELYLVVFSGVDVDVDVQGEENSVDEEEEEEHQRQSAYRNDAFWDEILSDDSDAFELDEEDHIEFRNAEVGLDEDVGLKSKVGVDQEVEVEPDVGLSEELGLLAEDGVYEEVGLAVED